MIKKFTTEEKLIIRSALLNYKKAPFVSDDEKEIIQTIIGKIYDNMIKDKK
tara:strand:- start:5304 stop:5456 length:153 start_codon:yes stop_codon:yes gene_type:complete